MTQLKIIISPEYLTSGLIIDSIPYSVSGSSELSSEHDEEGS